MSNNEMLMDNLVQANKRFQEIWKLCSEIFTIEKAIDKNSEIEREELDLIQETN